MTHSYLVGLDLGQINDYTAVCVVEKRAPVGAETSYDVRHLERMPLGTPYPAVVARVTDLMRTPPLDRQGSLIVDATGVGRAVVDLFAAAQLYYTAVTITGGNEAIKTAGGEWHVPKRDVVGAAQVLLQTKRLRFAESLPELPTLLRELQDFKVKITAAAHDTYGAWREGSQDDLVFALCLALWGGEQGFGGGIFAWGEDAW
jgi:hypothetical protein